jgi:hypothetical protein
MNELQEQLLDDIVAYYDLVCWGNGQSADVQDELDKVLLVASSIIRNNEKTYQYLRIK